MERHVCEGAPKHIPLTRGPPQIASVQRDQANYVAVPTFSQAERDEGLRRLSEQNVRLRGHRELLGRLASHVGEDRSWL